MWYAFDEHKNIADSLLVNSVAGQTYTVDGVEVYCLLGSPNADHPLFVDKNHDLSYYVNGSDWVDSSDHDQSPGTYGYEWGGLGVETGITATAVGTGLSNTNSLIEMNLQPNTDGWYVVWDKIKEFRQDHSDNWFLPSKEELNLVYEARSNLNGLTTIDDNSKNPFYWSSSELTPTIAYLQVFSTGAQNYNLKGFHQLRSRLCYTL